MAAVSVVSHLPDPPLPASTFPHADKLFHFLAYAALGAANYHSSSTPGPRRPWRAALLVGGFGLVDEFHQSFVPGRDASLADVCADAAGGLAGAWLAYFLAEKLK